MMQNRSRKLIAAFTITVLSIQTFYPGAAYAITSGPTQPEMQKFEPAGVNDMVDLFTVDFKQNIPLMDVGGYPVNLSYQSGTGVEDEASWVGAGWTLNPGAVNRNMRGLPDDFNGDKITKVYSRKPFKKVGGEIRIKASVFAKEVGSASLKLNVYKDNYYGIGANFGAGVDYNLGKIPSTTLTAGLGLDINSDTRDGVSITPSVSIMRAFEDKVNDDPSISLSGSFTYNTRSGLKQVSLGQSFSTSGKVKNDKPYSVGAEGLSATHYFGQTYTPSIQNNSSNSGFTFNFDAGPTAFATYLGFGGTGYTYSEVNTEPVKTVPAYGYMNYLNGQKNENALLDFNREKDGVFITSAPSIPIPVSTQDYFMATGQAGSAQYRSFYGGNYVVFDQANHNKSSNTSFGLTVGAFHTFKGGARVSHTTGGAETHKWTKNNDYLTVAEPSMGPSVSNAATERTYFKKTGEMSLADIDFLELTGYKASTNIDATRQVGINDKQNIFASAKTYPQYKSREETRVNISSPILKNKRDKRTSIFSFLNAGDAAKYGIDKTIRNYSFTDPGAEIASETRVVAGKREKHHISEIRVTDNEGKRMIYGIPVYNTLNQEVSFAITPAASAVEGMRKTGLYDYTSTPTDITTGNSKGRDHLYSEQKTPPYATSFLLTGILSPDYVDVKNDGITDDDMGTAVKFNYSKLKQGTDETYKWRAPYNTNTANYNEGFLSDPKDDKGSFVYGEKEIRYLNSIESKTMIAIFTMSDREDGLGVNGVNGGKKSSFKLKKIERISLYSKADWLKRTTVTPVPVKVVHFEYDYSLYPAMPNNTGATVNGTNPDDATQTINLNQKQGKLTLRKVYFTFGTNGRGWSNPYEFSYENRTIYKNVSGTYSPNGSDLASLPVPATAGVPELTDAYTTRNEDRWGTYRPAFYNKINGTTGVFSNSEYPYSLQANQNTGYDEKALADRLCSMWQLKEINTPTGAIIKVEYETDDYAYVQDRQAMQMCPIVDLGTAATTDVVPGLIGATTFTVELPYHVSTDAEFKKRYLNREDKIFYKVLTDIDGQGHYEYVQGYAALKLANCTRLSASTAAIALMPIDGKNPVAKAAWQMLRTDLPQYAYSNYDNTDVGDGEGAIRAIGQAIVGLGDLFQSFSDKATKRKFADKINVRKSFIRLLSPDLKKLGGGSRVKKISISDEWQVMGNTGGGSGAKTATYGQTYEYTTLSDDIKDASGKRTLISSGVAAYEPSIGNEENPFHEPENFAEKVHWSTDRYHFIEKPYCESYFPAAQVGYSKVTVKSFGADNTFETGFIENEFYTAKDFPVIVDNTGLDQTAYENGMILKLFTCTSVKRVATSQGFKVELNDMHGKEKAVKVFNKGGDMISSSEYFYKLKNDKAALKELDNRVDVLNANGSISSNTVIATDVDLVTDVRESKNESYGGSVGAYIGMFLIPFPFPPFIIPIGYGAVIALPSISADSYNSISLVKVVHRYGIVTKVKTMQNGSTTEAENLLWDGETGDVLLTKNQTEFDKYTYAFHYPAYMVEDYANMGGAYKNIGATLTGVTTGADGAISSGFNDYLTPGDELVWISNTGTDNLLAWVIKSGTSLRLIDKNGDFVTGANRTYTIIRSGYRNLLNASAGAVVCMNDPRVGGNLVLY